MFEGRHGARACPLSALDVHVWPMFPCTWVRYCLVLKYVCCSLPKPRARPRARARLRARVKVRVRVRARARARVRIGLVVHQLQAEGSAHRAEHFLHLADLRLSSSSRAG